MDREELTAALLKWLQESGIDPTASRIEGEYAVGIETDAGEYFIEVQDA